MRRALGLLIRDPISKRSKGGRDNEIRGAREVRPRLDVLSTKGWGNFEQITQPMFVVIGFENALGPRGQKTRPQFGRQLSGTSLYLAKGSKEATRWAAVGDFRGYRRR